MRFSCKLCDLGNTVNEKLCISYFEHCGPAVQYPQSDHRMMLVRDELQEVAYTLILVKKSG